MELFGLNVSTHLFLFFNFLILVYLYFIKSRNIWKSMGIPYLKRYPILGSFGGYLLRPQHAEDELRYKKYGRLYGSYEGSVPVLTVAEPDLLKDILVKDFHVFPSGREVQTGDHIIDSMVGALRGEDWKRVRTVISPAFTTGKLRRVCGILANCSKTLTENFLKAAREGTPVNCKRYFDAYLMDVIVSSLFGMKMDPYNDPNNKFLTTSRKIFQKGFDWRLLIFSICPSLMKLLGIRIFEPDAIDYLESLSVKLIEDRKTHAQRRNDLLQLLIDSTKEDTTVEKEEEEHLDDELEDEKNRTIRQNLKNKSLSQAELVAQSVMFLIAGFEGASGALSLLCHSLALNPECQEKLIEEIDRMVERNREIDYDIIREMSYLDCVIKETIRMYPPGFRAERMAAEDYVLGSTGITIPKGVLVNIPIYALHHDPEFHPDPDVFKPERFCDENKEDLIPYTYIPFGSGPRNCLGMRLALLEMKMCLVHIFQRLRFSHCSETQVRPEIPKMQFVLSPKSVVLKVEERTDTLK